MSDRDRSAKARSAPFLIVGLAAALVFGILVLAGGDWLPGTIIVVAALAGLAAQVELIGKLRNARAPGSQRSTPGG